MFTSKQDEHYVQSNPYEHVTSNSYSETPNNYEEVLNLKQEIGKKLSYEEMRGQLLRKREAPPPNIVQDRIKKFETVEPNLKSTKKNKNGISSKSNKLPTKEKLLIYGVGKRNRHKGSRSKVNRRALHSDSEAIAFQDSDESSDDLTMKSAPILLSPLSCVLADLRKTAESVKEKLPTKDVLPTKIAMKEYFSNINKEYPDDYQSRDLSNYDIKGSQDTAQSIHYEQRHTDEAEYLPMNGLKYSEEKEPEYVMMGGCKLSPGSRQNKNKNFTHEEEHVYNEPFSPPPSFLHDVYEKQKTKHFQYQMKSSSSQDSLTENIYEKPVHRFQIPLET
ncbi:pleckstrin y domain-containing family A member 7 [Caerostris extrusa]|uniref:Pleckstrin y domain-containing family A member 7 n=1 Tax=Caerostris extrusa TaxID=172846 RepID=A0AAV4NK44_CAEEX|nr:pleckstrin y domain-containing family A member 7 [Caerostris extrusa]